MRGLHTIVAFVAGAFFMVAPARANSIGVNFGGGNGTLDTLAPADLAGVPGFAQTNFNNLGNQGGGALIDSNGTATGVNLAIPIGPGSGAHNNVSGTDERLNSGFIFLTLGGFTMNLSGIPYSSYSLIVYDLNSTGEMQGISAGGLTYYSTSPNPTSAGFLDNNPATPFNYTRATSTSAASPTPLSDYALFTGLSGSNLTITATPVVAGPHASTVSGFQIVETPEPSTGLALLFGMVGMGCKQRSGRGRSGSR